MTTRNRLTRDLWKKPYARMLIPAGDGIYAAEVLEFPGCFAEGKDPTEAMNNLDAAAQSWIEAALEQNQEIPEPLASYGYSGKLNLRLPKSIHRQAARFAQRDDVSLNQFLAGAVAARVGAEEFYDRLIRKLEDRMEQAATVINVQPTSTFQCVVLNAFQSPFLPSPWEAFGSPSWSAQHLSVDFPYPSVSITPDVDQVQEERAGKNA